MLYESVRALIKLLRVDGNTRTTDMGKEDHLAWGNSWLLRVSHKLHRRKENGWSALCYQAVVQLAVFALGSGQSLYPELWQRIQSKSSCRSPHHVKATLGVSDLRNLDRSRYTVITGYINWYKYDRKIFTLTLDLNVGVRHLMGPASGPSDGMDC